MQMWIVSTCTLFIALLLCTGHPLFAAAATGASLPVHGRARSSPPQTVGVVGGGIGGAAFAYYYKKAVPNATVIVFEARDYIGGRLKHTVMHNTTIELGGDAWSTTANHYIVKLARELSTASPVPRQRQPPPAASPPHPTPVMAASSSSSSSSSRFKFRPQPRRRRQRTRRATDPPLANVAVWNGTALTPVGPLLKDLGDDKAMAALEGRFVWNLDANYVERGDHGVFDTVGGFLNYGGLTQFSQAAAAPYFSGAGISLNAQDYLLEPLARGIYDQNLDNMQAFSAIVAVTSLLGADSFPGGNSLLVERMLAAVDADVRLSTRVTAVQAAPPGTHGYTIVTNDTNAISVDALVIACPIEFTNVTFPPSTQRPVPRSFQHIFVTIVRAQGVNPTYFGLPEGTPIPYDNILTTRTASTVFHTPFVVVEQEATLSDGTSLWKLFSNTDVQSHLMHIFLGLSTDPADTVVQVWPYTFPELVPIDNHTTTQYQPLTLDDNLYYVNTMESVASAMEGSIISARNIALILSGA
eukprot:m.195252 g.195252  ORF g.195252 m.195252 type:complete len:526 (-) comp19437_c0_seq1:52-1629(-)